LEDLISPKINVESNKVNLLLYRFWEEGPYILEKKVPQKKFM